MLEGWVPTLKIERLLVADDEAASNPLMRAAMAMAVPPQIRVVMTAVDVTDFTAAARDPVRTLVLLRDVGAAVFAHAHGLPKGPLNVGNLHAGAGRTQVTRSVFLSPQERTWLRQLEVAGMQVSLQALPGDPSLPLPPL